MKKPIIWRSEEWTFPWFCSLGFNPPAGMGNTPKEAYDRWVVRMEEKDRSISDSERSTSLD